MSPLSTAQLHAISLTTRLSSILSILGSLFIVTTFLLSPSFRKPVTRLIFYATWGNLITNGATLISTTAIPSPTATTTTTTTTTTITTATTTALCKAQAFLIQWFMLADPFWVFCMALNVWLVFRRAHNGRDLRRLEKWYGVFAYGVPAIAAVGYLVHDLNSRQQVMGPAILWCWVGREFEWMRIVFCYAIVWVLAGATMGIYVFVGVDMYKQQAILRALMKKSRRHSAAASPAGVHEDPFFTSNDAITVTTEIEHDMHKNDARSRSATPGTEMKLLTTPSSPRNPAITNTPATARSSTPRSPAKSTPRYNLLAPLNPTSPYRHKAPLLISHRATAYAAPLASGDFATLPSPRVPIFQPAEHAAYTARRKENAAAYRYLRVAMLLFVALLVVWVPSSANSLHQIAHPARPSFGLNLVAALVLPLQGLGNAVVYASTTWVEGRRVYKAWFAGEVVGKEGSGGGGDEAITYNGGVEMKGASKDASFLQTV